MKNGRMGTIPTRAVTRLLVAVGLAAVTGCASDVGGPSTPTSSSASMPPNASQPPVANETVSSVADAPLQQSLESVALLTTSENTLVYNAQQRSIQVCMAERGFEYPFSTTAEPEFRFPSEPTMDEIETSGYLWRLARFEAYGEQPQPEAGLSSSQLEALEGTAERPGCGETSAKALGAEEFGVASSVLLNAYSEHQTAARSDPLYESALDDWSNCLGDQGYDAIDLEQVVDLAESLPGQLEGEEARVLAIRDYGCRDSSGLTAVELRIVHDLDQEWLEDNPGAVEALNDAKERLIERAEAIIE